VAGLRERAGRGEIAFGTIDTWLLWKLTGGRVHATDVTNASRTQLMDLNTLDWDEGMLEAFDIPRSVLPAIASSSEVYAEADGVLAGVKVAGILGDQQAALVGQACFSPGEVKNTYGTGCFMLMHTGGEICRSKAGLITTVAYRFGKAPPCYALEGSIAIAGALIQWLRDNLGLIRTAPEVETLAKTVEDNGDVYIVPAFSGLYAPYWRDDARGIVAGLTRYARAGHFARAALEAVAYQTCDVAHAMEADSGIRPSELKADGGMVANQLLMQFQADMLGAPVVRPEVAETTALGAAYAAGLAVGVWSGIEELAANWAATQELAPGAELTLAYLAERHPLGIITNGPSDSQHAVITALHLERFFRWRIVSGDATVGIRKPQRGIFDLACNLSASQPEHTWYIGDSLVNDIAGAAGAGWRTCWISASDASIAAGLPAPDARITRLDELPQVIGQYE